MTEKPWEPAPLPAGQFHRPGRWANINRAPYDRLSGVIYKRAMNIKRVRYEPANPAPTMPAPWQGEGVAVVRWLFSEQPGTEEGLLDGTTFEFLHDTRLAPGASTGQHAHAGTDEVLYVIAGEGRLYHRPDESSPVVARPLRPGDAVLIRGGELHSVANTGEAELHLMILGLRNACRA